jgi:hypothetical protein
VLSWDERKRQSNLEKHGVDFADTAAFDWDTAVMLEDERFPYDEQRFIAVGWMKNDLHTMAFSMLEENAIRVITLRKATKQERRLYGKNLEEQG